jgi:hypothetical protein
MKATVTTQTSKIVTLSGMSLITAEVLLYMLNHIGGDSKGPRGDIGKIVQALYHAGVEESKFVKVTETFADGTVWIDKK